MGLSVGETHFSRQSIVGIRTMATTSERTNTAGAGLALELTYAERKLLASGRTLEVAAVLVRRCRRRLYLSICMACAHALLAVAGFSSTGPLSGPMWARSLGSATFGVAACFTLLFGVRAFRQARDQIRQLEARAHHDDDR
jgi:hypothetical protein